MANTDLSPTALSSSVSPSPGPTSRVLAQFRRLASDLMGRLRFAEELGLATFGGRRDIYTVLGYKRKLTFADYWDRYERGDIATRIIHLVPDAMWVPGIELIDNPDAKIITSYERGIDDLFTRLGMVQQIRRAHVLSAVGNYSVLMINVPKSSDWSTPLPTNLSPDDISSVEPYDQRSAKIISLVRDTGDPRFGLPEYYEITTADPLHDDLLLPGSVVAEVSKPRRVHHSRIIHVTHDPLRSPLFSAPELQSIWNRLDDLEKNVGGGSEAAWRSMGRKLHVNAVGKNVQFRPGEEEQLDDMLDEFNHDMRDMIKTQNMELNPLNPQVANFGSNASTVEEIIAGSKGIPVRILFGSERGELASDQDRNNFRDQVIIPRWIRFGAPLLLHISERFVSLGCVPKPRQRPEAIWPGENELSEEEKARVCLTVAQANLANMKAGGGLIKTGAEIREIYHLDPLTDEEAGLLVEEGEGIGIGEEDDDGEDEEEVDEEGETVRSFPRAAGDPRHYAWMTAAERQSALQPRAAFDLTDTPPDEPEWRSVHRAADQNMPAMQAVVLGAWDRIADEINEDEIVSRLESGQITQTYDYLYGVVDAVEISLLRDLESQLLTTFEAGGMAALRSARARGGWTSRRKVSNNEGLPMPWTGQQALAGLLSSFSSSPVSRHLTFSPSFSLTNPRVTLWARDRSSKLVQEVTGPVRSALRAAVELGVRNARAPRKNAQFIRLIVGLHSRQMRAVTNLRTEILAAKPGSTVTRFPPRDGVRKVAGFKARIPKAGVTDEWIDKALARYARMHKNLRARTIGRTETINASNQGQREVWLQAKDAGELEPDQKRAWISTPDTRCRDEHAAMEGQERLLTEPFEKPDGKRIEPGEEVSCRCAQGIV